MMRYEAAEEYLWVIKDEAVSEKNGLLIPDHVKVKPNKGVIVSIGYGITDPRAVVGKKAIFNKQVGQDTPLEEDEGEVMYTILRKDQVLGYETN